MTTTPEEHYTHHGRAVKRFREMMRLKQEDLADRLGDDWSQKKISQLENKEQIEDAILEQVARSLNITPDAIKNYTDEAVINYYNTFNDGSINNGAVVANDCVINPTDEWRKAMDENRKLVEENKALYERLLKAEQEKVALLEKMLEGK